jgi:hypothetical protein
MTLSSFSEMLMGRVLRMLFPVGVGPIVSEFPLGGGRPPGGVAGGGCGDGRGACDEREDSYS